MVVKKELWVVGCIICTSVHIESRIFGVFNSLQGRFDESLFLHWKDSYECQSDESHLRKTSHTPTA